MDSKRLEQIRQPNFPVARRGYERRDVDNFLLALADWLEEGGQEEAGSYAVTRKLERAGETTARVLATAQAEAEQIVRDANDEARATIAAAREAARKGTDAAKAQARTTIDEAEQRRAEIASAIRELSEQRNTAVDKIEHLREVLAQAVAAQRIAMQRPAQPTRPKPASTARGGPEGEPAVGSAKAQPAPAGRESLVR